MFGTFSGSCSACITCNLEAGVLTSMKSLNCSGKKKIEKWKKLPCPILTRWYTVGVGCKAVIKFWDRLLIMAKKYATGTYQLLQQTNVLQLLLSCYVNKHFLWFQEVDEKTKQPGCRSRHMAARHYIMDRELRELKNTWQSNPEFLLYLKAKREIIQPNEIKNLTRVEKDFFDIAHMALKKHFDQWIGQKNLPYMLGSDNESVQVFALLYFNRKRPDTTFHSTAHKESVHVRELIEFVRKGKFVREKTEDLHDHDTTIKELVDGNLLKSVNLSP